MSEDNPAPARRAADSERDRAADRERILRLLFSAILLCSLGVLGWWYWQQATGRALVRDGAPNFLPDSRRLIFASESGGQADLVIAPIGGPSRQSLPELPQLTTTPSDEGAPSYSPDGEWIAFETDRDGNFEIYKMRADFTTAQQLTKHPARDIAPAWSPDGSFLVFMSNRSHPDFDLFRMNADGTGVEQLTQGGGFSFPQVSPDGTSVAFHRGRDIHLLSLSSRNLRRVTYEPDNGMHPAWSPDGKQLAFMSWRNGRTEIFTCKASGTDQQLLVQMPSGDAVDPRWSPDGQYIAFVHVTGGPDERAQQRVVFVVDVQSKRLIRISR